MTFVQAAIEVLSASRAPRNLATLWARIEAQGLVQTSGKTPQATLSVELRRASIGSQLKYTVPVPVFYRTEGGEYGLLEWLSEEDKEEHRLQEVSRNHRSTTAGQNWREGLWFLVDEHTQEHGIVPEFRMHWAGRPDLQVEIIVVDGQPHAKVTKELRLLIESLDEEALLSRLQSDKQREYWKLRANRILDPATKTVSLLVAFSAALLPTATKRATINLNIYESQQVDLNEFGKLLPKAQQQLLKEGGLSGSCSLNEIGDALGLRGSGPKSKSTTPTADDGEIDATESEWEGHHNVIFFGPPGTGKSHAVQQIVKNALQGQLFRVTFHPETTYHDFVGTYRPTVGWLDGEGSFADADGNSSRREPRVYYRFEPGPFSRALVAAARDPHKNVVLVIEEINRGNCAAIFGDVFQLLDRASESHASYGLSDYSITPVSEWAHWLNSELPNDIAAWDGSSLRLPKNLYLFATMNTSDQGLFPMDSAFRRRWGMSYKGVTAPKSLLTRVPLHAGDTEGMLWREFSVPLNEEIVSYKGNDDKQLGPFFIRPRPGSHLVSPSDFASKVLYYLWSEVFRDAPNRLFLDGIATYDQLVSRYKDGKEIFRPEFTGQSDEPVTPVAEETPIGDA